ALNRRQRLPVLLLSDAALDEALPHDAATVRAGIVHRRAFCRTDKFADLLEAIRCQPSLPAATLHGEAVRDFFIGSAELMATLVTVNPKFHSFRHSSDQFRIEDQKPRIGRAVIIQRTVQNGGSTTANQPATVQYQLPSRDNAAANVSCVLFDRRRAI
ncbi:MAG: hypothetical protein JXQ99_23330, partial [Hyphomicrobiaceae bacterium]